MYLSNNIEQGLRIINDFVVQHDDRDLDVIETAIIRGSLENITYQEMKQREIALQYNVDYISRNLAYDLWKRLTFLVKKSALIENKFQVKKKNLWYLIEQIARAKSNTDSISIVLPFQTMEEKILLDRYEIEEHLFDRDSGERHFRASDRCLGNKPCLVIQRCHQTSKIRQQFEQEAKVLSELGKHPQIPQLLAYFSEDRYLYLIYEQISGKPLTELLTGSWQESAVKLLLCNLLNVLEFIQQNNVIHRNLNPDNIIQAGNKFILIDFATVKEIKHPNQSISQSTFAQGMTGYMPPEQPIGVTTFASDIYAIGKIAIHALTGIHPRKLKINPRTANIIWRDRVQVSDRLAEIIDRATSHHFLQRYQSASEMLEILNDLAVV